MTGRTHLIVGIAAGLMAAYLHQSDLSIMAAAALAGGIGGLLPDIDHPQSIISGFVPGSGLLRMAISHRGPTHTLLFIALFAALWVAVPLPYVPTLAFMVGMLLHLICDMATPAGVRLLWPIYNKSWRILPYAALWAGAWLIESFTSVGAIALIGLTIYRRLQ